MGRQGGSAGERLHVCLCIYIYYYRCCVIMYMYSWFTHHPLTHTSTTSTQAEWCAPFLLQLLKESPLAPPPSSTHHTTMTTFPTTTPTTPSPRRRRGRQQQPQEAVAVAVVPNSPQRQPQWALHAAANTNSLPFRLRLFATGAFTPRTPRRAANKTGGERGTDELLSGALPSAPGRPCVPGVLDTWAAEGGRLGLVVCGPEGLGVEARHWAVRRGVDLHEEVFHW